MGSTRSFNEEVRQWLTKNNPEKKYGLLQHMDKKLVLEKCLDAIETLEYRLCMGIVDVELKVNCNYY